MIEEVSRRKGRVVVVVMIVTAVCEKWRQGGQTRKSKTSRDGVFHVW
jgi:hypothetical protein